MFDTAEILKKWPEWKAVRRVIRVERSWERLSQRSVGETEISYYCSNRELSAKEFAQLIREYWWCENKNHYPKEMKIGRLNGLGLLISQYWLVWLLI